LKKFQGRIEGYMKDTIEGTVKGGNGCIIDEKFEGNNEGGGVLTTGY
jgi:hypothetical protein